MDFEDDIDVDELEAVKRIKAFVGQVKHSTAGYAEKLTAYLLEEEPQRKSDTPSYSFGTGQRGNGGVAGGSPLLKVPSTASAALQQASASDARQAVRQAIIQSVDLVEQELAAEAVSAALTAEAAALAREPWRYAVPAVAASSGHGDEATRQERGARDKARQRLVDMFGPALGFTPATVGKSIIPRPLRAKREAAAAVTSQLGPGAHHVSAEQVAALRPHLYSTGGRKANIKFGPGPAKASYDRRGSKSSVASSESFDADMRAWLEQAKAAARSSIRVHVRTPPVVEEAECQPSAPTTAVPAGSPVVPRKLDLSSRGDEESKEDSEAKGMDHGDGQTDTRGAGLHKRPRYASDSKDGGESVDSTDHGAAVDPVTNDDDASSVFTDETDENENGGYSSDVSAPGRLETGPLVMAASNTSANPIDDDVDNWAAEEVVIAGPNDWDSKVADEDEGQHRHKQRVTQRRGRRRTRAEAEKENRAPAIPSWDLAVSQSPREQTRQGLSSAAVSPRLRWAASPRHPQHHRILPRAVPGRVSSAPPALLKGLEERLDGLIRSARRMRPRAGRAAVPAASTSVAINNDPAKDSSVRQPKGFAAMPFAQRVKLQQEQQARWRQARHRFYRDLAAATATIYPKAPSTDLPHPYPADQARRIRTPVVTIQPLRYARLTDLQYFRLCLVRARERVKRHGRESDGPGVGAFDTEPAMKHVQRQEFRGVRFGSGRTPTVHEAPAMAARVGHASPIDVALRRAVDRRKLHTSMRALRVAQEALAQAKKDGGARGRSTTRQDRSYHVERRSVGLAPVSMAAEASSIKLASAARAEGARTRAVPPQKVWYASQLHEAYGGAAAGQPRRAVSADAAVGTGRPPLNLLSSRAARRSVDRSRAAIRSEQFNDSLPQRPEHAGKRRLSTPMGPLATATGWPAAPRRGRTGPGPASYRIEDPAVEGYWSNAHATPAALWGKATGRDDARHAGPFRNLPAPSVTSSEAAALGVHGVPLGQPRPGDVLDIRPNYDGPMGMGRSHSLPRPRYRFSTSPTGRGFAADELLPLQLRLYLPARGPGGATGGLRACPGADERERAIVRGFNGADKQLLDAMDKRLARILEGEN